VSDDETNPIQAESDEALAQRDAIRRRIGNRDQCRCLGQRLEQPPQSVKFHRDRQDTGAAGWRHLLELIEEAADDRREEFKPLVELSSEERRQVVRLPPAIAKLTAVRNLVLYGSNLVRIPPEIGAMRSLEEFTPLHLPPTPLAPLRGDPLPEPAAKHRQHPGPLRQLHVPPAVSPTAFIDSG